MRERAISILRNPSDFLTPQELEDMKILVWERERERVIQEFTPEGRPDENHQKEIDLLVRAIRLTQLRQRLRDGSSEPDYKLPTFVVYDGDSDEYDFSF